MPNLKKLLPVIVLAVLLMPVFVSAQFPNSENYVPHGDSQYGPLYGNQRPSTDQIVRYYLRKILPTEFVDSFNFSPINIISVVVAIILIVLLIYFLKKRDSQYYQKRQ